MQQEDAAGERARERKRGRERERAFHTVPPERSDIAWHREIKARATIESSVHPTRATRCSPYTLRIRGFSIHFPPPAVTPSEYSTRGCLVVISSPPDETRKFSSADKPGNCNKHESNFKPLKPKQLLSRGSFSLAHIKTRAMTVGDSLRNLRYRATTDIHFRVSLHET